MAAPVAQPLQFNTSEDTPIYYLQLQGTDADFDLLTYEIVSGPANGLLVLSVESSGSQWDYKPFANFNGSDSFTYRVFGGGEYSDTVTVDLTVAPVADMPVVSLGYAPVAQTASTSHGDGFEPELAVNGNGQRAEVWTSYGFAGDAVGIAIQLYDTGGFPIGDKFLVNTTLTSNQIHPDIAALVSATPDYVVTWSSDGQDGSGLGVYMQRINRDTGSPIGAETLVNTATTGNQYNASVTGLSDGGWLVVWEEAVSTPTHIKAQRYDAAGNTVGGEQSINNVAHEGYEANALLLANGNYLVHWTSTSLDGFNSGIAARLFNAAGTPLGSEFVVNESTSLGQFGSAAVALGNGGFVVAFGDYDVGGWSLARFDAAGVRQGTDQHFAIPGGASSIDAIALPGGGFAVAWDQFDDGVSTAFVQRFDAFGAALADPVPVHSAGNEDRGLPALAVQNGKLVVLFREDDGSPQFQIRHQEFTLPATVAAFDEGTNSAELAPLATLSDADSAALVSINVRIVDGARAGDIVFCGIGDGNLRTLWDDNALTIEAISGSASFAEFEEALRLVQMRVNNAGDGHRVLEITATAADGTSQAHTLNLTINTADQYVTGSPGLDNQIGGTGNDTITTGLGVDTLTGNGGNDSLLGGGYNDQLYGGDGDDTLDGGAGADYMQGELGNDVYRVNDSGDSVIEFVGEGVDTVHSALTHTLASHVENLVLQGSGNLNGEGNGEHNVITGTIGHNLLAGHAGDDSLYGEQGNDTLDGGAGADVMFGGHGDDAYHVTTGDVIVEYSGGGIDVVYADMSWAINLYIEDLVLQGTVSHSGWGNALDNQLHGNNGNNELSGSGGTDSLFGSAGNDTLNGGEGDDWLEGGLGNDVYLVDSPTDFVIENVAEGIDTVRASSNHFLMINVEHLTLVSSAGMGGGNASNNRITGNSSDNTLTGFAGNDTLFGEAAQDILNGGIGSDFLHGGDGQDTLNGGAGYDWLYGGAGSDELIGGGGVDHFVFNAGMGSGNEDHILDFAPGADKIVLASSLFTALGVGPLAANAFVVGATATTADHRIVYDSGSGWLYYDADGNGGGGQLEFAVLDNLAAISHTAFVVS